MVALVGVDAGAIVVYERPQQEVFLSAPRTPIDSVYVPVEEPIEEQPIVEEPVPVKKPVQSQYCSCITTARNLGVSIPPRTNAWDLEPNTAPIEGGLVLLSYGVEHVAVVSKITEKGFYIKEGNYRRCKYTERFLRWDNKAIRGFYIQKTKTTPS